MISREAVQRLLTNGECYTVDELVAAIAALPAVQPAPVTVEAAQAVRRFLKHRSVMSGIDRDAILTIGLSVSLTVADLEALVAYVIGPNQAGEAQ
jgi:hypothetical protein